METKESWKDVANYSNYEVSTFGNVRNKNTGRILKPANQGGYYNVGLSNVKTKSVSIHRLVAIAFIPNPENKLHVNHIDKNSLNNKLENLEWATPKENNIHKNAGVIFPTSNQLLAVFRIDKNTNEILDKYDSIDLASKWIVDNGYSSSLHNVHSGVSCAARGVYKSSFGFKWKIDKGENLENEIWKEINIEGKDTQGYFISSLGRFKNKKGVIMKNYKPHHSGYIYLRVNRLKYALHRLVALTFIENNENKPFVNHIDGIKTNNCVDNLEWVTCAENNLHNHKIGLITTFKRKITQYDINMNKIKDFQSIVGASKELNMSKSNIKAVLYKKQNTAGGFIFKYLGE
jgi:hypothetical protein